MDCGRQRPASRRFGRFTKFPESRPGLPFGVFSGKKVRMSAWRPFIARGFGAIRRR